MENEKLLKILLQFSADKSSLTQVRDGIKPIETALKEIETQAQKTRERMEKLESSSIRIGAVGLGSKTINARKALRLKKVTVTRE